LQKLTFILGLTATSLLATTLAPKAFGQSLPEIPSQEIVSQESTNQEIITPLYVPDAESKTSEDLHSAEVLFDSPDSENSPDGTLAQSDIELGRLAKSNYSYISVGVNIGFDSDGLSVGDTGFAIDSKIALSSNFSIRPSAIIAQESALLIPITYDFRFQDKETFEYEPITPYLGVGGYASTDELNEFGFLITGGLDYKLSDSFVANTHLNVGIGDSTEVGLVFGVGYIFSGE
jgi:hypothetical protein